MGIYVLLKLMSEAQKEPHIFHFLHIQYISQPVQLQPAASQCEHNPLMIVFPVKRFGKWERRRQAQAQKHITTVLLWHMRPLSFSLSWPSNQAGRRIEIELIKYLLYMLLCIKITHLFMLRWFIAALGVIQQSQKNNTHMPHVSLTLLGC